MTLLLTLIAVLFLLPIGIVFMNSFKGQFYIADAPFALPNADTFAGLQNYISGVQKTDFFSALIRSAFITILATLLITVLTAMTAWYLVRVRRAHAVT